jgi:hypothetical protein
MGIQQNSRLAVVEMWRKAPHIVAVPSGVKTLLLQKALQHISSLRFVAAYTGCGYQLLQQFNSLVGQCIYHLLSSFFLPQR